MNNNWRFNELAEMASNLFEVTLVLAIAVAIATTAVYCAVRALNGTLKPVWAAATLLTTAGLIKVLAVGGEIFRVLLQREDAAMYSFTIVAIIFIAAIAAQEAAKVVKDIALLHSGAAKKVATKEQGGKVMLNTEALSKAPGKSAEAALEAEIGKALIRAMDGRSATIDLLKVYGISAEEFMNSISSAEIRGLEKTLKHAGFRRAKSMAKKPWRIRVML